MKLTEERNYQKLLEILDELELTEENQRAAAEYFHPEHPGRAEALSQMKLQDFSCLTDEKQRKSAAYVEHLNKRGRTQELLSYVRFVVAAGGSTAHYLLDRHLYRFWQLEGIEAALTGEAKAAIKAEGMAWNQYRLSWRCTKELAEMERKQPGVLKGAMELCCHTYDNTKVFLAALFLNRRRPEEKIKGLIKGILSKNTEASIQGCWEVVEFLEKNLKDSLPELFQGAKPGQEEMNRLQAFVESGGLDAPFPQDVDAVLRNKKAAPYLTYFLSGCAFLAFEHSSRVGAFLRLSAALDPQTALNACQEMSDSGWFSEHKKRLEEILPISPDDYIRWYLARKDEEGLRRMAAKHPQAVRTVAERAATEDYQFLMRQVQKGNPQLFKQMDASYSGAYQAKMAEELIGGMAHGSAEARQYLLGEGELCTLYPFVNGWRGEYNYNYQRFQKLRSLQKNGGRMFRRGLVLEGLRMQGAYFVQYLVHYANGNGKAAVRKSREEVEHLVEIFEKEGMPMRYQADAMEGINACFYQEASRSVFLDSVVESFASRRNEHVEEIREALALSTAVGRGILIRVLDRYWQEEKEAILSCTADSSKQVKEVLAAVCAGHREWEPDMRRLLKSKKSQERELAIQVMLKWGVEGFREELTEDYQTEKSKKLKELLEKALGIQGGRDPEPKEKQPQDLAAEVLKGGKKRKVAWAYETPFSPVHKKDGSEAEEEYLQAVLVAYADPSVPGVSRDAARLAEELSKEELARYVAELLDKWLESGAEAKKKWVLYAASVHGGEAVVQTLWRQIQEWPQQSRGAMAAEAVKALAVNGSPQALLLVDQISRKFKFRQVKTAAAEALEFAASALGISRAQLEDRIVPNLGFDGEQKRVFHYGARSFCVYLTPALELEVYDEGKKKLKNLPAPGKRDDAEMAALAYGEYKHLKKQLKTVVSNQKLRLEQALIAERLWTVPSWEELFVKNPVMHQFAIGLVWGLYEEGVLKETFRYMEDGSFNTCEEEELKLPAEGKIGLVHPIELSKEELSSWKAQLEDYEITQPVEQLDRPVYRLAEEEKGEKELARFGGKLLNGLSLSGKLLGMGWYRGSVQDGGVYDTFYREDGEIAVELEFSGSYVGDENDEVTVYGASFYRAGTVKHGSYVYDEVKPENRFRLDEVGERYFSEMVLQLEKATASSQERVEYPACKSR